MNRSIPPKPMKMDNSSWAMRRLQRRRSVGLRPMPASGHGLSATAAIAGALRDPLGLSLIGFLVLVMVLA